MRATLGALHPFAPKGQAEGYLAMLQDLEQQLADITGFHSVSLQPNSGAQGEYTGLMVIDAWQRNRGEGHRKVCLIPTSAHGTNPASATMMGMKVYRQAGRQADRQAGRQAGSQATAVQTKWHARIRTHEYARTHTTLPY